jgi:hypothetical protein
VAVAVAAALPGMEFEGEGVTWERFACVWQWLGGGS